MVSVLDGCLRRWVLTRAVCRGLQMPVGANKPGKHGGVGGAKLPRADEQRADKEPESPAKAKSSVASKSSADDAKKRSQFDLTAEDHLRELRVLVKQASGPDIKKEGWTCKLVPSPKADGAAAAADVLDPCWVEPETGKEFYKRKKVLKHLGLSEPKKVTREEAATTARESFKERNKENPLPQKIGEVTVLQWGKVPHEREGFHSKKYIWPIGFKSEWSDENQKDVSYVSEIRDGKEETGAPDGLRDIDAPVFVVRVTKKGEDPAEFFGKNGKRAWQRATNDDSCPDRTGLKDEEVCKRLEGLKNAASCKNYEFIATREMVVIFDDEINSPKKKKKKAKSANGDVDSGGKLAGKKRKADGEPKKESQKAKRAREKEARDQEKAREKEEKERKKAAAAEERQAKEEEAREKKRLIREEEARERKRRKELEDMEQQWVNRYPIEDLAIELERQAMEAAEKAGGDVAAQRAAARAVVDAVERGYGQEACLAAGREAAESRAAGESEEEALEKAAIIGENVHQANLDAPYAGMEPDDRCYVEAGQTWRVGSRVRMLFKEKGEEVEKKYRGFVCKLSEESKKWVLPFVVCFPSVP